MMDHSIPHSVDARIDHWEQDIREITRMFLQEFGPLDEAALNWKPEASTWSIAQIMEHLIIINETYFPIIRQIRQGTYTPPFIGKFAPITRLFGNLIFRSVSPDRKNKIKTFSIWEPAHSRIDKSIVERFSQHQQDLIEFIRECKDLLEADTVIHSPANRLIVYKLEKAFDIMVSHEKRHFNQGMELLLLQKTAKPLQTDT